MQGMMKYGLASLVLGASLALNALPVHAENAAPQSTLEERLANARAEEKRKRDAMLAPTVMFNPVRKLYTGSAVIVYSGAVDDNDPSKGFEHYALTVFHVADKRNIILPNGKRVELEKSGEVVIYDSETMKKIESVDAQLDSYDQTLQLGMIRFVSKRKYLAAKIIPPKKVRELKAFRKIYAVGCHKSDPPSQMPGEITSIDDTLPIEISGRTREMPYWRANTELYAGASGGGVFTADTGELIGLLEAMRKERVNVFSYDFKIAGYTYITVQGFTYFTPPTALHRFLRDRYDYILKGMPKPHKKKK